MTSEERSNDGAPIAVHRAVDLLYEVGAWLHDVACGDAEFDAMHDALDGRLVPFADAALNESRSSVAAVERERDESEARNERLALTVVEKHRALVAALARIAAVEALIGDCAGHLHIPAEVRACPYCRIRAALAASLTPTGPERVQSLLDAAKARNACHETGDEIDEATRCHYAPGLHRHVPATPEPTEETP